MISQSGLKEFFEKLLELSRETEKNGQLMAGYGLEMMALGISFSSWGSCVLCL